MIFNENKLQEEIIKTWGEFGSHNEVFKAMTLQIKELKEQLNFSGVSKSVVCGDCDGYGYTVDENGRRKEHCNECE